LVWYGLGASGLDFGAIPHRPQATERLSKSLLQVVFSVTEP
jgi:hypothetical protein